MGSLRKIKRNKLRFLYKTNKIKDLYHEENDPLWKKFLNYNVNDKNKNDRRK